MKKSELRKIIRKSIKENLSKPTLQEQPASSCPTFTAHIHAIGHAGNPTPNWEARFIGNNYQWNACMQVNANANNHWYNNVWLANFDGMCPSWMPSCWLKAHDLGTSNTTYCIKYLGTGKWNFNDFKNSLRSKDRSKCAPPAPACGLYLLKIEY